MPASYNSQTKSQPKQATDGHTDVDPAHSDTAVLKILIAGGFGVGKTTTVRAISEIEPISTEEFLTQASTSTDSLDGVETKSTTTVAFDFGRVTFDRAAFNLPMSIELMLFGTPGQERFKELWYDLARGSVGAVVLADTRRLSSSFDAVNFCENAQLPFIVAVNEFDGAHRYPLNDIRQALGSDIPVMAFDARVPAAVVNVLLRLVDHALDQTPA